MNRRELLSLVALPVVAPLVKVTQPTCPDFMSPHCYRVAFDVGEGWTEIQGEWSIETTDFRTGDVTRYYGCFPREIPDDCQAFLYRDGKVVAASLP